jgi:hypothetical protein
MKLYIIGNGFDIAHHIKCKYCDFEEFLGENYPDYYGSVMHGYCQSTSLWKDFENELPSCATHIEEWGLQMGNEMRDEIDYDPMDDMGIGRWLDDQYRFLNELPKYLRLWVESIDTKKDAVYKINKDSVFLTFNYTDTLENVYCIDPDNIKHIHGYVKNKKEELVIGHCNQKAISYALEKKKEAEIKFVDFEVSTFDRVSKYCNATLKRTSRIIDENTHFFKNLSDVDEVIIIGHSLNTVDMPYFKKVLNSIRKNAVWIAYYHEATDKKRFETILIDLGVGKENISVHNTEKLKL